MPSSSRCSCRWHPIHTFRVGDSWIGVLFSAKAIVQIVASPLTAKIVGRAGCRVVSSFSCGVLVVSTAVYASSGSNYWLALAARAVQGVGSSGILVAGQTGLSRTFGLAGKEGTLFSTATLGYAVGVLLGPTIGANFASRARPPCFHAGGNVLVHLGAISAQSPLGERPSSAGSFSEGGLGSTALVTDLKALLWLVLNHVDGWRCPRREYE